jgi:hypothetical protein
MTNCKDCRAEGLENSRPAPHRGPRCVTHHRLFVKASKAKAHARRVFATYGLSTVEYLAILDAQGGRCAICGHARGVTVRLAVDHDHKAGCDHDPATGCPECVRGLLCKMCNTIVGRFRDDPQAFLRGAAYLTEPPARAILRPDAGKDTP